MRINRSRLAGGTVAAAATFALAAFALPTATAAPAVSQLDIATTVANTLGAATGGHYLDSTGHAVVTVLNQADAAKVTADGATAKVVKYSLGQLSTAKSGFDRLSGISNAGWGIDPAHNQVVLDVYDSTPAAARTALLAKARSLGDQVRVVAHHGAMKLFIRGGDEISNGQALCSNGFNVTKDGKNYLLSAGHCGVLGGDGPWNGGQVVSADFPTEDSMLVENNDSDAPSEINDGTKITSIADATVGEQMKRAGRTSGVTSGQVTKVDYTFSAEGYTVYHEFCSTAKSGSGDSGGPAYDGGKALGTLSGGDGSTSCFYPVSLSSKAYGVSLPQ